MLTLHYMGSREFPFFQNDQFNFFFMGGCIFYYIFCWGWGRHFFFYLMGHWKMSFINLMGHGAIFIIFLWVVGKF